MLTNTQLRTRIDKEITQRESEATTKRSAASSGKDQLFYSGQKGSYQWEYVHFFLNLISCQPGPQSPRGRV